MVSVSLSFKLSDRKQNINPLHGTATGNEVGLHQPLTQPTPVSMFNAAHLILNVKINEKLMKEYFYFSIYAKANTLPSLIS